MRTKKVRGLGIGIIGVVALATNLLFTSSTSAANVTPSLKLTTGSPVGQTNLAPGKDSVDYSNYSVSVKIDSTDIANYTISIKANSSDMVGTTNSNNKLKSVPAGTAKTLNQMVNEWGYRWNLSDTASDAPLKDYSAMPTTDTAVISNYGSGIITRPGVSTTKYFTLGFGATVNQSQPADTYTNKVIVSVIGEPITDTIFTISNMQDMYSDVCDATTTPAISATRADTNGSHQGDASYVPETTLTDKRNGKSYTIRKLADGNCWMSEDLQLEMTTSGYASNSTTPLSDDFKLTNEDTDLNGVLTEWTPSIAKEKYGVDVYTTANTNGGTDGNWSSNTVSSYEYIGTTTYYNFPAATLGSSSSITDFNGEAPITICPRGWTMPLAADVEKLFVQTYKYATTLSTDSNSVSSQIKDFPINFQTNGEYDDSYSGGAYLFNYGAWWLRDKIAAPMNQGSNVAINDGSSGLEIFYDWDSHYDIGHTIRCIAR